MFTPAAFWNARESRFREHLARAEQMKGMKGHASWVRRFPYGEMAKLTWLKPANRVDEKAHGWVEVTKR